MTHNAGPGLNGRQVWQRLMEGNMRFVQGLFQGRNLLDLRRTLAKGQQPEAAVLSCSDSRVPAEIIFDQSLGDLQKNRKIKRERELYNRGFNG